MFDTVYWFSNPKPTVQAHWAQQEHIRQPGGKQSPVVHAQVHQMHSQISQLQPDSRSPEEGAATPLHCALAPSLANTTGVLLKRLQKEEIEAFASDQVFLETCFLMFLTICLDFGEEDGGSQQILGWAA